MARLRILAFVGLGFIVAIAALPQTRWVLINDLSSVRRSSDGGFQQCLDPRQWPDTPENRKARAVVLEETLLNPNSGETRLKLIGQYCKEHPTDIAAWAHLVRIGSRMPVRTPEEPSSQTNLTPAQAASRSAREAVIDHALQTAGELDPKNCYFPLMRAILLMSQGKKTESRRLLKVASELPDYRDYTEEEGGLAYNAALRSCGYRGAGMQVTAEASTTFPQFIWLMRTPYIQQSGALAPDREAQLAAMRVSHNIARQANYGVTVLSMKSVFEKSLMNMKTNTVSKHKRREDLEAEARAAAEQLDAKLGGHEVRDMLSDFDQVDFNRYLNKPTSDLFDEFMVNVGKPSFWGLVPLLALAVGIPVVFLCSGISRVKLWLLRNQNVKPAPALWTVWAVLGTLGVALLLYASYYHGPGFISALGYETPDPAVARDFLMLGGAALTVGALFFIPRRGELPFAALAVACAVFPAIYFGHVLVELRQDQKLKQLVVNLPKEADTIRGDWR